MLNPDGTYEITADELAELVAGGPFWWIFRDGSLTSTAERVPPAESGVGYLMSASSRWIEQWGGDWQRACDEVLNPALSSNEPLFPDLNTP